jgi:hypothetical protein
VGVIGEHDVPPPLRMQSSQSCLGIRVGATTCRYQ